jgi:hypothetical protein
VATVRCTVTGCGSAQPVGGKCRAFVEGRYYIVAAVRLVVACRAAADDSKTGEGFCLYTLRIDDSLGGKNFVKAYFLSMIAGSSILRDCIGSPRQALSSSSDQRAIRFSNVFIPDLSTKRRACAVIKQFG